MTQVKSAAWRYWIGLGANLGAPQAQLELALEQLDRGATHVLQRSSWWTTDPVGGPPGQPAYTNGVALLGGRATPMELLTRLQDLEWLAGRRRASGLHHGPRLLDLDVLDVEPPTDSGGSADRRVGEWGWSGKGPRLVLPHPRLGQRRFVLGPWAEIASEHRLPCGASVRSLLLGLESS